MNTAVKDMSNGYPEHGAVMDRLVSGIFQKIKTSRCTVMREQKYHWDEDTEEHRYPDVSVLCDDRRRKALAYTGVPRFIAEVLSDSTEAIDRGEKMELYALVGVEEYWILDWRKKTVERYLLNDNGEKYILHDVIKDTNKEDLALLCLPMVTLDFDEIFDLDLY